MAKQQTRSALTSPALVEEFAASEPSPLPPPVPLSRESRVESEEPKGSGPPPSALDPPPTLAPGLYDVTCTDPQSGVTFPRMRIRADSPQTAAKVYRENLRFRRADLVPTVTRVLSEE